MKKFLQHILKYSLLVFLVLNSISILNLYFLRNSSFYKPEFLTHEVKESSFDYIIIGSSIGLTTLNTVAIDTIIHKKGINLSIDDTSISSNYLMLNHFFLQNKKTKICVLAVNYWDLETSNPTINNNDYRFLPFVNENYVYEYYKNLESGYFKPLTFSHFCPFIGVGYYNTEVFYPSIVSLFKPNFKNRFDDKGNYSYPESGGKITKAKTQVILHWKNPYIYKIKELCDLNNTKLIIYQAPIFNTTIINYNQNFQLINDCNKLTDVNYFYDEIHLNEMGRKEVSGIFAKEFKPYFIQN